MSIPVAILGATGYAGEIALRILLGHPGFKVVHIGSDRVAGLNSGADAYLEHPVEPAVLVATVQALIRENRARVEGLAARLEAVSYNAVLARGFALVQGADGTALTQAAQVAPGAALTITFQDGQVKATAAGPSQGSISAEWYS